MKSSERVMIAGAGIGGLTAAIALRRAGFEVAVFERESGIKAAGRAMSEHHTFKEE